MFPGGKIPGEDFIFSGYTVLGALAIGMVFGLRSYMRGPQCIARTDLEKQTAIVTGSNSGIGLEIAKDLACRGARVIIACRNEEKGQAAVKDVIEHAKSKRVRFIKLDLASLKSVRDFVEEFKASNKKLNLLINNAGVMYNPDGKTEDGHEVHFQINYLGHFLLTNLLLDMLKASGASRIVNFTCPAYALGEINWEDLASEVENTSKAFSLSKLAVMYFNKELAKRLEGSEVTTNVIHPGVCYSDFYRNMPFMQSKVIRLTFTPILWFMMKTSKDGAQTAIQVAVSDDEKGVSGKYYADCRIAEPDEKVNDAEAATKLWKISEDLVGVGRKSLSS